MNRNKKPAAERPTEKEPGVAVRNAWRSEMPIQWCPGCGNYAILDALCDALDSLGLDQSRTVIVSGIGQAGKLPHYVRCNYLHGLHGRALAHAAGVKLANPELTVIAVGGDGDMYGEGCGHLVHAMRRNQDITCLVHNNGVYGLTKGQPSPTATAGQMSHMTPSGVVVPGLNPIALGVAAGGTFVARGFAGRRPSLSRLIAEAIQHKGFGFVDILQPCVTYNKLNTFQWYEERVYESDETGHDSSNREAAFVRSLEWPDEHPGTRAQGPGTGTESAVAHNGRPSGAQAHEQTRDGVQSGMADARRIPLGVFYREQRKTYEELAPALRKGTLVGGMPTRKQLDAAMAEFI